MQNPNEKSRFPVTPRDLRRTILEILHRSKAGHLGSNMSAVEMLLAMFASVDAEKIRQHAPDRSRIIVSKGHCAAATYSAMMHFGIISPDLLCSYHLEGSSLTGHVNHTVPGVEHSTGALGTGPPVAAGCAVAGTMAIGTARCSCSWETARSRKVPIGKP